MPRFLLLRNNYKIFCKVVEYFASVFRDEHNVFDTDADSLIRQVNSRLYRKALSWLDDVFIDGRYIPEFMILQADRVACPVCKVWAESFFRNIITACSIYISHSVPRPGSFDSSSVGLCDTVIDLF